jgi:hypothetical protein
LDFDLIEAAAAVGRAQECPERLSRRRQKILDGNIQGSRRRASGAFPPGWPTSLSLFPSKCRDRPEPGFAEHLLQLLARQDLGAMIPAQWLPGFPHGID